MTVNKHKKDRKTVIIIHIEIVKKKEKTCYKKALEKTEESRMDTPELHLWTHKTQDKKTHTRKLKTLATWTNQQTRG
jgi:hypothetical protein